MTVDQEVRLAVRSWDVSSCEPGAGLVPAAVLMPVSGCPLAPKAIGVATPTPDAATASEGAQW
ncbi:MAG TPA: hypothetical protein VIJ23_09945 [Mycobacterium sp.]